MKHHKVKEEITGQASIYKLKYGKALEILKVRNYTVNFASLFMTFMYFPNSSIGNKFYFYN